VRAADPQFAAKPTRWPRSGRIILCLPNFLINAAPISDKYQHSIIAGRARTVCGRCSLARACWIEDAGVQPISAASLEELRRKLKENYEGWSAGL
jgi:hypothetical protein